MVCPAMAASLIALAHVCVALIYRHGFGVRIGVEGEAGH